MGSQSELGGWEHERERERERSEGEITIANLPEEVICNVLSFLRVRWRPLPLRRDLTKAALLLAEYVIAEMTFGLWGGFVTSNPRLGHLDKAFLRLGIGDSSSHCDSLMDESGILVQSETSVHLQLAAMLLAWHRFTLFYESVWKNGATCRAAFQDWEHTWAASTPNPHSPGVDLFCIAGDIHEDVLSLYQREDVLKLIEPPHRAELDPQDTMRRVFTAIQPVFLPDGRDTSALAGQAFRAKVRSAKLQCLHLRKYSFREFEPLVDAVPLVSRTWHRFAMSERL